MHPDGMVMSNGVISRSESQRLSTKPSLFGWVCSIVPSLAGCPFCSCEFVLGTEEFVFKRPVIHKKVTGKTESEVGTGQSQISHPLNARYNAPNAFYNKTPN